MSRPSDTSTYRPDIDGLRALAVVLVVLFHLGISWMPGGFVGVDVFFVISGYLITGLIVAEQERNGAFRFTNFYLRRARRLGPALLFTLFVTAVAGSLLFAPDDLQRLGGALLHAVLSVSNVYFWLQSGYFDPGAESAALLHTWSLSVEEQFYLVWPMVLVFLLGRGGRRWALGALVVGIVVSLALNLAADDRAVSLWFPQVDNDTLERAAGAMFYLTPFRVFELGIGGLLVFLPQAQSARGKLRDIEVALGLAGIATAALVFSEQTVFPSYSALLPCLGTALVIHAGAPRLGRLLLCWRGCVWLGLRSYSLYLVHWPIIVFCKYWYGSGLSGFQQAAIGLSSLFAAAFMYRFIEQPFRRPLTARNTRFVSACAALACVLILVGANQWGSQGWMWRLDGRAAKLYEASGNPETFHRRFYGGAGCKPVRRCTVNAGRAERAYFVGDSHMLQYAAGLAKAFPAIEFVHLDNRCRYNTLSYCYAGRWQDSLFLERKATDFEELRDVADAVVVGQAWYDRQSYYDPAAKRLIEFDDLQDYVDFLSVQLAEIDRFLGHGRLVVVGEVNRFGHAGSPLSCLGKPFSRQSCARSKPSFAVEFNRRLGAALGQRDIAFVDPTGVTCSAQACRNFVRGQPIYSDIGHLSVWGSEMIVEARREVFARVFDQVPGAAADRR
ncbi:MAG: acyltransferase family protein [Gammaproteobacteria bacterium]